MYLQGFFESEPRLPDAANIATMINPTVNAAISNPEYLSMLWMELKEINTVLDEQFASLEKKSAGALRWYLGLHSLMLTNGFLAFGNQSLATLAIATIKSQGIFLWTIVLILLEFGVIYKLSKSLVIQTHYAVNLSGVFPKQDDKDIAFDDERTYSGSLLTHKWTVAEWNRYVLNFRGRNLRYAQVGLLALAMYFLVSLVWVYRLVNS